MNSLLLLCGCVAAVMAVLQVMKVVLVQLGRAAGMQPRRPHRRRPVPVSVSHLG